VHSHPGRPRSQATRRKILDAAIAELFQRGYGTLTIEGIAARAGAGKQTIYRWWDSKADLVLDAMLDLASSLIAVPDTGSLAGDLETFLTTTFNEGERQRPVLLGLMAEALLDPVFHDQFRDRFLFGRRAELRTVFERARARGELDPDVDIELLLDVAFGVLWYRLMLDHAPLNKRAGRTLAALVTQAAS
jgi:AcrR family transcriptional regulator